jgi:hypothetical protein
MLLPRVVVVLVGIVAGLPAADAQEAAQSCQPACAAGQRCVDGVCMVPAPAAPAQRSDPEPPAPAPSAPAYGYGPPPVGYGNSPGYGHPHSAPPLYGYTPPPHRPPIKHGDFLALPLLGIHSVQGSRSNADPGLRIGALLGWRVTELFSANIGLVGDIANDNPPPGYSESEYLGHLTFSPLLSVGTASVEFVIGPKAGVWRLSTHITGSEQLDATAWGWTLGLNAGVFFPVSEGVSLGGLFSYESLQPLNLCATVASSSAGEQCTSDGLSSLDMIGLAFALLI